MRNYPQFNFPAFFAAEDYFKSIGWEVFNPAQKDEEKYGLDMFLGSENGDQKESEDKGFCLRTVLAMDLNWVCKYATHIYMLRGWEKSTGATAEHATAVALGLEIIYEN